ncbi:unnamed protein product, partial [Phaeothamnion confervicola]
AAVGEPGLGRTPMRFHQRYRRKLIIGPAARRSTFPQRARVAADRDEPTTSNFAAAVGCEEASASSQVELPGNPLRDLQISPWTRMPTSQHLLNSASVAAAARPGAATCQVRGTSRWPAPTLLFGLQRCEKCW